MDASEDRVGVTFVLRVRNPASSEPLWEYHTPVSWRRTVEPWQAKRYGKKQFASAAFSYHYKPYGWEGEIIEYEMTEVSRVKL